MLKNRLRQIFSFCNQPVKKDLIPYILSACVLSAVLLRTGLHCMEPAISRDGVIYIELAREWLEKGEFPVSFYLPLYPWMIKMLMGCGMSGHAAGLAVNIAFGSLLPPVIYAIARTLKLRRETALTAAILMVFHPPAAELSIIMTRDVIYLFFCGCALCCGLAAIGTRQYRNWLFCGAFCAVSLFVRYETLELIPLLLLVFTGMVAAKKINWKFAVRSFAVFMLSLLICGGGLLLLMDVHRQMGKAYNGRIERLWTSKI